MNLLTPFIREYKDTECLLWTGALNNKGYPVVRYKGRTRSGHRIICEIAHGRPKPPKIEAAHTCGVRACINPNHLRWSTPAENAADALIHGTRRHSEGHQRAKLRNTQVEEIRSSKLAGVELAALYGVSEASISMIRRGHSWRHL